MLHTHLIRPVSELLASRARELAGKVAYRDAYRAVTYEELFTRTGNLAGHLRDLGLERGDKIAIFMGNRVETVESYFAITRAAGVCVSINPQVPAEDAAYMLSDSGARAVFTDAEHADFIAKLLVDLPDVGQVIVVGEEASASEATTISYGELAGTDPSVSAADELPLDDPAFMLYTSRTTGRPKGVLLSQRSNLWVVAACWAPIVGFSEEDYILSPLPLFHSYALNAAVLAPLAVGATEYVMPRFSTKEVLRLLREEPVTLLLGVPTMYQYLLQEARDEGLGADELRACIAAGAIMSAALNQDFEDAFGVPLLDGYGITETSTMVTENWLTGARVMGSCGLPLPGSAVRLVDPSTGVDVQPGEEGELWVRGPHVMLGYHNRPEETEEVLSGGWFHTGDLARSDEHGYLRITGRIKELIIRGGQNIAPVEVEEVVAQHSAVVDCAVVAAPHEDLGEVPIAFVVPQNEATFDAEELLTYCSKHLVRYKVPAEAMVIDSIPRTGSGKTMRFKLQERLTREGDT
jgi:acyl-CoA synthetase (AMP-forming)/AMP-acid ligase II